MSLHCPECGEQILSRRTGFCPGCYRSLPEALRLDENAKAILDGENERALRASSRGDSGSGDVSFGYADGGCDGGGD